MTLREKLMHEASFITGICNAVHKRIAYEEEQNGSQTLILHLRNWKWGLEQLLSGYYKRYQKL